MPSHEDSTLSEEEQLYRIIRQIQRQHALQLEPYLKRLSQIDAAKVPVHYISAKQAQPLDMRVQNDSLV